MTCSAVHMVLIDFHFTVGYMCVSLSATISWINLPYIYVNSSARPSCHQRLHLASCHLHVLWRQANLIAFFACFLSASYNGCCVSCSGLLWLVCRGQAYIICMLNFYRLCSPPSVGFSFNCVKAYQMFYLSSEVKGKKSLGYQMLRAGTNQLITSSPGLE